MSHYEKIEGPFEIPESWEWCRLGDICHFENGYAFSSHDYRSQGTPLIRISNIQNGSVIIDRSICIAYDVDSRFIISKGDLLIAMSGATTGKMGIYKDENEAYLNQRVGNIKITTRIGISERYRNLFMLSQSDNILKQAYGGAQPNISSTAIEEMYLPLPPISEQKRIVDAVEHIMNLIDFIESGTEDISHSITKTKEKILSLAISGKLVPQDPSDEPAIELLRRINPNFKPCDNSHYENLPKGWTICKLEEILEYEQPQQYIVESTEYSDEFETPVLTPGKSFILGYTNEQFGIYKGPLPVIIFDDFTTASKLVDFPFKVKSSAMKILHPLNCINVQYVEYYMRITRLVGDTHKRYWISEYSKLGIPIPPIKEQQRIVDTVESLMQIIEGINRESC